MSGEAELPRPGVQIFRQGGGDITGVAEAFLSRSPAGEDRGPQTSDALPIESSLPPLKKVDIASWNVAGMAKSSTIETFRSVVQFDLLAVQEFPKAAVGWHMIEEDDVAGCIYQDIITYRGFGFLYRPSVLVLLKKKKVSRGVWCKFRRRDTAREFWAGSVHFPKSEPNEKYHRFVQEFEQALPATDLPLIVLGDYNVDFKWMESEQGCFAWGHDTRWEIIKSVLGQRQLCQIPPRENQLEAPTFVSRKSGVRATQIDGVFARGLQTTRVHILEGSKTMNGSDHNQIRVELALRAMGGKVACKRGGARVLAGELPTFPEVNQHILQQAAKRFTKPKPKQPKFVCGAAARTLRDIARASQAPTDWKAYQLQMKRDRQQWKQEKLEQAVRDWGVYRQLTRHNKSRADSFLSNADNADPIRSIHDHFLGVFAADGQAEVDEALEGRKAGLRAEESTPFSEQAEGCHSGR